MRRDPNTRARNFKHAVQLCVGSLESDVLSLIEWDQIDSVTDGDGGPPQASTADGDDVDVLEPYGFASRPPGSATSIVVSPGGGDPVALGLSSPGGRPATAAGDAALWTASGHKVEAKQDGGLTIESKDGSTIELDDTGAIMIKAGSAASITIEVDNGQAVRIGDALADTLIKSMPFKAAMEAMLAAGAATTPTPMAGNNGSLAFLQAIQAWQQALNTTPIDTTKARGS